MSIQPAVLLISPGIVRWTDMDFGLPHLVSLGGYLREHTGVRVEIMDLNYEGGDHATLSKRLDELGPFLLVGLSCYSSFDYLRVMSLAHFLKEKLGDVPIVTGGYHASAVPEDVVFDGSPFDAVVLGEGERPITEMVMSLLGGGSIERKVWPQDLIADLDTLPPYAWDLLDRYWPFARDLGRKFQIYLSRGCTYHCTFCMERSKSGYSWRAFSPERAIAELQRLHARLDLSQWVVNLADPLFGFHRRWRRTVLEGIIESGIQPKQFWTLTRSDDLDDQDVSLLARARFSIGIGLESGSPTMLKKMQKGNNPDRYLTAMMRLARLSRRHHLNWATNVIIGHPGETPETLRETHAFLKELFTAAPDTCGWLSIDPFRLYPGSQVHQEQETWSREEGAQFHHNTWWKSWYDGPFRAQHIEPSRSLSYKDRVDFMYRAYPPLLESVEQRFRGTGRTIDRVYARSIAEQRRNLSPTRRHQLLRLAKEVSVRGPSHPVKVKFPLGLQVRDPWTRHREQAVRRLLDHGVLRTHALIEAMLQTPIQSFMPDEDARAILHDQSPTAPKPGLPAIGLPLRWIAMGLEALEPVSGDTVADLGAVSGYVAAILAQLVGPQGQVLAVHPGGTGESLKRALSPWPWVSVRQRPHGAPLRLATPVDGIWLGASLPRLPAALRHSVRDPEGRIVTFLGPRYRAQDMVVLSRHAQAIEERVITRASVPPLGGPGGWFTMPKDQVQPSISFLDAPACRLGFYILAHLPLRGDDASIHRPELTAPWVAELGRAYAAAAGATALHGLLLVHQEAPTLISALQEPPGPLQDVAGRSLCQMLAQRIRTVRAAPTATPPDPGLLTYLKQTLQPIRVHLWKQRDRPPPLLELIHVPALGRSARATSVNGRRRVATDLTQPREHVLMQLLHEEMHPITDPIVRARHPGVDRSTRRDGNGYALHQELELTNIAASETLLTALKQELLPMFQAWKSTQRLPTSPPAPR